MPHHAIEKELKSIEAARYEAEDTIAYAAGLKGVILSPAEAATVHHCLIAAVKLVDTVTRRIDEFVNNGKRTLAPLDPEVSERNARCVAQVFACASNHSHDGTGVSTPYVYPLQRGPLVGSLVEALLLQKHLQTMRDTQSFTVKMALTSERVRVSFLRPLISAYRPPITNLTNTTEVDTNALTFDFIRSAYLGFKHAYPLAKARMAAERHLQSSSASVSEETTGLLGVSAGIVSAAMVITASLAVMLRRWRRAREADAAAAI